MQMITKRPLIIPGAIAAVMLLGALGSWPYGYHTLLRWVTCAVAVIFAVRGKTLNLMWSTWMFGFVALLFNPIVPVHLSRQVWQPIDVITAVLFVAVSFIVPSPPSRNGKEGM